MNIVGGEGYEEMAATYQSLEIARLNEILKAHGIKDKKLRRNICDAYAMDHGEFLDSGWFTQADRPIYPQLCFAERTVDEDVALGEIETIYLNDDDFSFHEYAAGSVGWYFDKQDEDVSDIEQGVV